MDPEYVASWFVGVSAAVAIFQHLRRLRLRVPSMLAVNALVLGVLASGKGLHLAATGYVALGLWGVLVLGPALGSRRVGRLAMGHRFGEAARWARWVGWTHPFNGNVELGRYLTARARHAAGDPEGARRQLSPLLDGTRLRDLARLELLRIDDDFEGIVQQVNAQPVGTRDLAVLPLYLRALGETGRLETLLDMYARLPPALRTLPTVRLLCFAFSGRVESLRALLGAPLRDMPDDLKRYWIATAEQAAGRPEAAMASLEQLTRARGPARIEAAARARRPVSAVDVATLSPRAQSTLGHLDEYALHVRQLATTTPRSRRPWSTWALMLALALVFAMGWPRGATDLLNLVSMGALVLPTRLVSGDLWWRFVAAGFLHLGAMHLLMNLGGLLLIGSDLERLWDGKRMLVVFFGASIGAYASAPWLMHATVDQPQVLLGASAGVMGLVGALATFSAVGYFYAKNQQLRGRLEIIGIIIAVQLAFDWSTPIVASTLHASGFVLGTLLSVPFAVAHWRRLRRHATG